MDKDLALNLTKRMNKSPYDMEPRELMELDSVPKKQYRALIGNERTYFAFRAVDDEAAIAFIRELHPNKMFGIERIEHIIIHSDWANEHEERLMASRRAKQDDCEHNRVENLGDSIDITLKCLDCKKMNYDGFHWV